MGLFSLLQKKKKDKSKSGKDIDTNTKTREDQSNSIAAAAARERSGSSARQSSDSSGSRHSSLKGKKKKTTRKGEKRSPRKSNKKKRDYEMDQNRIRTPKDVLPGKAISSLAKSLVGDEWQRLAYALGFLAQAVSHFTARASSAQNTYSQSILMLRSWRDQMPVDEILPRLTDALTRIRRYDLALKLGLEIGTISVKDLDTDENGAAPKLDNVLKSLYREKKPGAPFYESRLIVSDERISFLARQLLAREEWKRLAYALGFVPDEVAHIIACASSSQNLYAQAHMMLITWRLRTPPGEIVPRLHAGFVRIRRHDLVDLLRIGAIAGEGDINDHVGRQLKIVKETNKKLNIGQSLVDRISVIKP